MKPTQDIIEELRDAVEQTTDPRFARLLTDAADRIEHLFASGIHTCHADCRRPMCVLRRELDKARADLARVTAERDKLQAEITAADEGDMRIRDENAALRARVAELEQIVVASLKAAPVGHIPTHTAERLPEIIADIATACSEQSEEREQAEARVKELEEKAERYRLATLKQDATIAELATDGNAATLAANLAAVSQRNAELEAALRDARASFLGLQPDFGGPISTQMGKAIERINEALARAESAAPAKNAADTPENREACAKVMAAWEAEESTPAKHPDTERLDWLEHETNDVGCFDVPTGADDFDVVWEVREHHVGPPSPRVVAQGPSIRAAIDAARKQGGAT